MKREHAYDDDEKKKRKQRKSKSAKTKTKTKTSSEEDKSAAKRIAVLADFTRVTLEATRVITENIRWGNDDDKGDDKAEATEDVHVDADLVYNYTLVPCPKCGQRKARFTMTQTRSSDEGYSTLLSCCCGHDWKED